MYKYISARSTHLHSTFIHTAALGHHGQRPTDQPARRIDNNSPLPLLPLPLLPLPLPLQPPSPLPPQ